MSTTSSPRVWLAGYGPAPTTEPVRDDQQRVWTVGSDGNYHTGADNRHHETPADLHNRTDLVEVR